ncbi:MAG: hypothetical protein QOI63_1208, partial [Thermoplasmata archaeon]|nr:hypothetical protein [Thermoplasmata archaeon]
MDWVDALRARVWDGLAANHNELAGAWRSNGSRARIRNGLATNNCKLVGSGGADWV